MTLIRPIRLALLLASFSSMPALAAPAPESSLAKMATEAMNQLYKRYDDAKKCWVTRYQGDIYCMEIDSVNQAGGMLHVFAIGSTSDAAHVTPGEIVVRDAERSLCLRSWIESRLRLRRIPVDVPAACHRVTDETVVDVSSQRPGVEDIACWGHFDDRAADGSLEHQ
jgi:hypothetical protein